VYYRVEKAKYINQTILNHLNDLHITLFNKPSTNTDWILDNKNKTKLNKLIGSLPIFKRKLYRDSQENILMYLKYDKKQKKYAQLNKDINESETQLQKVRQDKGELKQGELCLPFKTVIEIRDKLLKDWMAEPENKQKNMKSLIFCLNTLQPPLRKEILNMPFKKHDPKITNENYIYKTADGLYHYRINVETKHININNYTLDLSKELSNIIDLSVKYFTRKYLLTSWTIHDTPLPYSTVERWLKNMNFGLNGFRKSYVSNFYETNKNPSILQIEKLAREMRHSPETQQRYYNKRINTSAPVSMPEPVPKKKPGPVPKCPKEDYQQNYRTLNAQKVRDASQTYYNKNLVKARAKSYIYKLNSPDNYKGHIKNPKPEKIDEYKLKQDYTGKWYSEL
jgi:hypothetical protein